MRKEKIEDSSFRRIVRRFTLGLALFVCYVLSVGPASWLCVNGYGVPVIAVDVLYYPIWRVKRGSKTGARVIDRYLSHWISVPRVDFDDVPPEPPS